MLTNMNRYDENYEIFNRCHGGYAAKDADGSTS